MRMVRTGVVVVVKMKMKIWAELETEKEWTTSLERGDKVACLVPPPTTHWRATGDAFERARGEISLVRSESTECGESHG
jgi:hypothetical protein